MAKHGVVETSRLAATHWGAHIYSLVHDANIDNGNVGYVGALSEDIDGQETYEFGVFDSETIGKKRAVLVAHPEWSYDESTRANQALSAYYNKAGIPFRAFDLTAGDDFKISEECFDASGVDEIEAGQYVVLDNGKTTFKIVEEEPATAGFYGVITGKYQRAAGFKQENGTLYGEPTFVYGVHVERNDLILGE